MEQQEQEHQEANSKPKINPSDFAITCLACGLYNACLFKDSVSVEARGAMFTGGYFIVLCPAYTPMAFVEGAVPWMDERIEEENIDMSAVTGDGEKAVVEASNGEKTDSKDGTRTANVTGKYKKWPALESKVKP